MKPSIALAALVVATLPAAQAATTTYRTALAPEVAGATGSGAVQLIYDDVAHTLAIDSWFSGLSGTTTVAHIHCCVVTPGVGTVGVAVTPGTLPGFPTGVSSASYAVTLDLTQSATFTAGFVNTFAGGVLTNAEGVLVAGLNAGTAYFNVHSTTFGGGEIRGFLAPIPEPSTYALMALGMAAVGVAARRRRG
ncbi:MAG TPA: CHRD domain-containing protein [Rubrivivax sp.]